MGGLCPGRALSVVAWPLVTGQAGRARWTSPSRGTYTVPARAYYARVAHTSSSIRGPGWADVSAGTGRLHGLYSWPGR